MSYPVQEERFGVMGTIIGILLAVLAIDSHGMSLRRGKASVQKSGQAVSSGTRAPAPQPSKPAALPIVAQPAPQPAAPPRSPASTDPKGPEDRGIRDMGCNDRDREDPSKPCKNGGSVGISPSAPKPTPTPQPSPPAQTPTPLPQAVPASCARFNPDLARELPLGPNDGAEAEYRRVRDQALVLDDSELNSVLMRNGIGSCRLVHARPHCPHCFCDYYFQTRAGTWHGSGGWPLNPYSRASTGCVSEIQWGGYLPSMATGDLMKNAAEQARHALCHPADPCRLHPRNLGVPIHNSDVLGQ